KTTFQIHLLETEFRFNNRDIDLYHFFLKIFRENPLSVS
ncbi:MAG: IS1595 family transposase, partial [Oscillospiraceae bacterium]|nr:IS1595 family transposase [Oscillospiraceae bacterium]MDR1002158.1 IS1595 family transposase [Oscillospiraceae bacterium]